MVVAQGGSFGAQLRGLREIAGLTQEELASRAGLSADAVSTLERGQRKRPYPHTIRALADALDLSEEERAALINSAPKRTGMAFSPPAGQVGQTVVLPIPPTPLFGRERDLAAVRALLEECEKRLLTASRNPRDRRAPGLRPRSAGRGTGAQVHEVHSRGRP